MEIDGKKVASTGTTALGIVGWHHTAKIAFFVLSNGYN